MFYIMVRGTDGYGNDLYTRKGKMYTKPEPLIKKCNNEPKGSYVAQYGELKPVYINGIDVHV